jgi:hypothetical protein
MKFIQGKMSRLVLVGSMAIGIAAFAATAFAQATAPASPSGAGMSVTNSSTSSGNSSLGGTASAPTYGVPAAASDANGPPVNSGITDPKTGANNDTTPMASNPPPPYPGAPGPAVEPGSTSANRQPSNMPEQ